MAKARGENVGISYYANHRKWYAEIVISGNRYRKCCSNMYHAREYRARLEQLRDGVITEEELMFD